MDRAAQNIGADQPPRLTPTNMQRELLALRNEVRRLQGQVDDLSRWRESVDAAALGIPPGTMAREAQMEGAAVTSATPAAGASGAEGAMQPAAGAGSGGGGSESIHTARGRAVVASGRVAGRAEGESDRQGTSAHSVLMG